jgi:pimeloyl-ACP methyl ester carboxylesterase
MTDSANQARGVFCAEYGEATPGRPPLILVHGAGGTHLHWPPQVRRLSGQQVYALDLPGHGQSQKLEPAPEPEALIEAYAGTVLDLLDHLELPQAVIAGHSLGGAVALTLALNAPERVAGLGLVGSGARLRVAPDLLASLEANFEATVGEIINRVFGPNVPAPLKRLAHVRMLAVDPQVLRADWLACNTFDVRDRLAEITVPAMVITGTADQMTPEKHARRLAEGLPRAELCLVEGAGHMVMLEQPQAVAQALLTLQTTAADNPAPPAPPAPGG